jgi:hypothetical protein
MEEKTCPFFETLLFKENPRRQIMSKILVKLILYIQNWIKTGSTISKEWPTPDFRNTPSTTKIEGEEIVDAPGKDGNASMPEQVKRPNSWKKMMMIVLSWYTLSFIV